MHINFWAAKCHDSVFLVLCVAFPEPQVPLDAPLKAPLHVEPGLISCHFCICLPTSLLESSIDWACLVHHGVLGALGDAHYSEGGLLSAMQC